MTKKHFIRIAEILKDKINDPSQRILLAMEFAEFFKEENPNFREDLFLQAANIYLI